MNVQVKSFLAKQFSTLYYFYQYLGKKLFFLLFFNFLMVLMDGFGLTMFVPLLQIADNSQSNLSENNSLINLVESVFRLFSVELTVFSVLVLIVLLFISKAFFSYFAQAFQSETIQNFSRTLRKKLINGLAQLSYGEFVSTNIGRIQNTLIGETQQVANASSQYVETIKNGMIVAVYLGFAFSLDWKFSILVCVGGVLSNLIYQSYYKHTKSISREITAKNHDYSGLIIEFINHFKYLKATSRNTKFENRIVNEVDSVTNNYIQLGKLNAKLTSMREPIMLAIVCVVIGVQVYVFQSSLTSILIILVMFYRAMGYVMSLQVTRNNYLSNIGAFENVLDFENYLKTNKDKNKGEEKISNIDSIELKDVTLSYGNFKILNGIDLTIEKNQSIAFVGESGSGKTTLVNLICGLLSKSSGDMKVNDISFTDLDIQLYQSKVGYISQEPTVFEGTIYDNVTFWSSKSIENEDKFKKVAQMCSLDTFIDVLPNKENQLLGNNGLNISGGQKQRISIARELFRDVEILIMDEATSALDAETESQIKESIESLQGQVTIISIAHRLATIKNADQIYLLDQGKILEHGNFETLKLKSPYFTKLAELQGL